MPSQYDKPAVLKDNKLCLKAVSKNLEGRMKRLADPKPDCETNSCKTIKLLHSLELRILTVAPCDAQEALPLDGTFKVDELVTEELTIAGRRGIHAGDFVWTGNGVTIKGTMNGFINLSPHRPPFIDNQECAQRCSQPRVMEGRLTGKITATQHPHLKGCEVLADYRLRLGSPETAASASLKGTLEGVLVCRCQD